MSRLPVLPADGGAAVRELSDRLGQPRFDRELHVQTGDLERPKDTSVLRDEDELAASPGESRQCPEQHPQSRGVDEVHVRKIHHRVARPVAENPIELLLESRRLHLRSDVAIGAALSGGIDSSCIVGAMRAVGAV